MPVKSRFFPVFKPFFLCAGTNKELHFHLFKFTHTKNKLTSNNFISECFTNLRNSKWNFHTCCFLHIQKVYKNSLRCFRTQINFVCLFSNRTKLRGEHQIELTNVCPVCSAA